MRTRWGTVELLTAVDARDAMSMFELALPRRPMPVVVAVRVEAGTPNAHHYEMCGTDRDSCERIISTTPRLSMDKTGIVTLSMTTVTREQRWADEDVTHGTIQVRHVRVRTVRCEHTADGWDCSSRPS